MNKARLKNIVIIFLAGITFFSLLSLREKYALLNTIKQLNARVSNLEEQQQNLLQTLEKEKEIQLEIAQKNLELKDNLKAGRKRLSGVFRQAYQIQKELEDLSTKFSVLKSENEAARQKNSELAQENEMLQAKLQELRLGQKPQEKHPGKNIAGNRGFLVKDGQPASSAKLIIEVVPAPQPDKAQ